MLPDYLIAASRDFKLQNARSLSIPKAVLDVRVKKVYGTWERYEETISVLNPDQRLNYEKAGIILQPQQVLFAKAARECDIPNKPDEIGTGGARGGGKSYSVFGQVAVDDCQRFPGLKVLYLRKTAKASQEQMRDLVASTLSRVNCVPKATQISYPNGSRIVIGGYRDANEALKYQGIEFDVLVIEELTQLTKHVYTTLRLSTRSSKGWRPRTYNSFNPLGIGHTWVKQRFIDPFRKSVPSNTNFIPSTVDDNVFNNPEYVRNLEDLTGAELRAYRHGDWDVAAGAYFETWHHESHVIKPLTAEHLKGWHVWASMDAGFSHWNSTYLLAQDNDGNKYLVDELAHRKCHAPTIAPDITAMFERYGLHPGNVVITVGTDAFKLTAGQSETLADQYTALGLKMTAADMSPGSRIAGWQHIAQLLGDPRNGVAPRLFVTERCPKFIEAFPYLQRNPDRPEDVLKVDTDENGEGGDDFPDGARYGLFRPGSPRVLFESS